MDQSMQEAHETFEEILKEQRRYFADSADYLLEQMGRALVSDKLDAEQRDDAVEGLLEKIGDVASDSKYDDGQSILNRTFQIAQSSQSPKLIQSIEEAAVKRGFVSPAAFSLDV